MTLGCSAPNAIRLVDWPAVPCRPWLSRHATGQPSVSFRICRVAVLGGSPHQLTLSQSSPSGLWCGRQTAERDINGDSPFAQPPLKVVEVWLQVADKQRRLAGRGYDGRVVRVEGQLDVVRGWGHVVDIQTDKDRGDQSPKNNREELGYLYRERLGSKIARANREEKERGGGVSEYRSSLWMPKNQSIGH